MLSMPAEQLVCRAIRLLLFTQGQNDIAGDTVLKRLKQTVSSLINCQIRAKNIRFIFPEVKRLTFNTCIRRL